MCCTRYLPKTSALPVGHHWMHSYKWLYFFSQSNSRQLPHVFNKYWKGCNSVNLTGFNCDEVASENHSQQILGVWHLAVWHGFMHKNIFKVWPQCLSVRWCQSKILAGKAAGDMPSYEECQVFTYNCVTTLCWPKKKKKNLPTSANCIIKRTLIISCVNNGAAGKSHCLKLKALLRLCKQARNLMVNNELITSFCTLGHLSALSLISALLFFNSSWNVKREAFPLARLQ